MYDTMLIDGGRYLLHGVICAYAPFPILGLAIQIADTDTKVIERDIRNAAQLGPRYPPNGTSD